MRLHPSELTTLPRHVMRPLPDRNALASGIVHLGVGAFMRAHLAVATECAMAFGSSRDWGIVGVSLQQAHMRNWLTPQEGLYALAVRDAAPAAASAGRAVRERLQVVGCLQRVLLAPMEPGAVMAAIAHPACRILSLTITEKGYCRAPGTADALDTQHPDVLADAADPAAPRSALGVIVRGLQARRAAGLGGITLMSLDNLPSNGKVLCALVMQHAQRLAPDLAPWVQAQCSFPSSMVDRIVPRTTDADVDRISAGLGLDDACPVVTEPFFDWVVEDHFVAGRPAWEATCHHPLVQGGVRLVADAAPWEQLKLRTVNAAHSAMAYLGQLAGWRTVDEAMAQPGLRDYVRAMLLEEVGPSLPPLPGLDLGRHVDGLMQRFANPALAHQTAQIAMDGSQKLPPRLLDTVRWHVRQATAPAVPAMPRLALAIAAWAEHIGRCAEGGAEATALLRDPMAGALLEHHAKVAALGDAHQAAAAWSRFAPVFGDLADAPALVHPLAHALQSVRIQGVEPLMRQGYCG